MDPTNVLCEYRVGGRYKKSEGANSIDLNQGEHVVKAKL